MIWADPKYVARLHQDVSSVAESDWRDGKIVRPLWSRDYNLTLRAGPMIRSRLAML
jgi:hypothetical protein